MRVSGSAQKPGTWISPGVDQEYGRAFLAFLLGEFSLPLGGGALRLTVPYPLSLITDWKKGDKFVNTFTMFLQLFKEIFEITIQITLSIFTRAHLITCTLTIHWRSLKFTSVSLSVFANNFSYIFQVCWCLRLLIRKRQKYKFSWADIPYRTKEIKENHME